MALQTFFPPSFHTGTEGKLYPTNARLHKLDETDLSSLFPVLWFYGNICVTSGSLVYLWLEQLKKDRAIFVLVYAY